MTLDSLWPWRGALLALVVALAWSGLLRLLRRPDLAALGAGLGIAAGAVLTLGAVPGSPRQLPERLPLLLLAGTGLGLLLLLLGGQGRRAGLAVAGTMLGLLAGAWWLAGAPLVLPDARRGTLLLLGLAVLLPMLALALRGPLPAAAAAAVLAAGLWLAAPAGPWLVLALVVLGGVAGGLAGGTGWPAAARLPVALALGGVLAGPVIARGAAPDWTVAAGPVAVLWVAPVIAEGIHAPWLRFVAWIVAGGLPLLFTWMQVRGP